MPAGEGLQPPSAGPRRARSWSRPSRSTAWCPAFDATCPTPAIGSRPTSWTTSTSSSTSSAATSIGPARPPSARLGAVGLIHPFPTALVAISTGILGLIAGGTVVQAATLTLAMAGFQASIGALNDLHDRVDDAVGQPWKPIPSGRVGPGAARSVVVAGAVVGSAGSLVLGAGDVARGPGRLRARRRVRPRPQAHGVGLGLLRARPAARPRLCLARCRRRAAAERRHPDPAGRPRGHRAGGRQWARRRRHRRGRRDGRYRRAARAGAGALS